MAAGAGSIEVSHVGGSPATAVVLLDCSLAFHDVVCFPQLMPDATATPANHYPVGLVSQ